jgi:16S rRNA (adenine1518-N6/adenine1519-N6)-dimethyltransferase
VSGLSAETRGLLAREGLAPRKRLGQHFLVDRAVVTRMIGLADIGAHEAVLEIGPGLGALTADLAARAARLYVVEYDRGLCQVLQRKFAAHPELRIIEGDVLRIDLRGAIPEGTVKVVSSLPYNVAVPILFRLLEERLIFSDCTVMVQREIAERLVAAPGTPAYGAPSVLLQLHAEVLGRFRVAPSAFYPRPQVTSEVLRLRLTPEPRVPLAHPRMFTAVVRAAFNQRRKMLRNAVQTLPPRLALPPAAWDGVFAAAGVDGRARGETLDLRTFAVLADTAAAALAARPPAAAGDTAAVRRRGRAPTRER